MDSTYRASNTLMVHGYLASLVHWLVKPFELYRLPYAKAVAASKNFDPLQRMTEVAKKRLTTSVLVTNAVKAGSSQAIMIDLIEKG